MNLAIMDRNVIHAFGASDHADELERAYLLARDRLPPERAEAAAWQWARVCNVIAPTLASMGAREAVPLLLQHLLDLFVLFLLLLPHL
jgi:hypothetical protein